VAEIVFFDIARRIAKSAANQVVGVSHVMHQDRKHDGWIRNGKDPVKKDRDPLISSRASPCGHAMQNRLHLMPS
jgi:hypothetical protein